MSTEDQTITPREHRKSELQLTLFRHGFEIVNTDTGATYVRVSTTHESDPAEPLMLDYKRDIANYVNHGFGSPHDVAMHFVHRYAFRTHSWLQPLDPDTGLAGPSL
jgi:hypothetical protein